MARLVAHDWPGNARELRNTLRQAAAFADEVIDLSLLALDTPLAPPACELRLASRAADAPPYPDETRAATFPQDVQGDFIHLSGRTFAEMQTTIFRWALHRNQGSRRQAAASLGISRSTFCDRVRRLGLSGG